MKKIAIIFFLFYPLYYCYSQNNIKKTDSIAMISREKADIVLSHFDTISSTKILYSLLNKYYYIIIQDSTKYKEYYISIDTLNNITNFRKIDNVFDNSKVKYNKKNRFLNDHESVIIKAFDLSNYHTDLITYVPNATYVSGVPSYFVVKDKNKNRYGEYSLSSITAPSPIDPNLWVYLSKKISEQIEK